MMVWEAAWIVGREQRSSSWEASETRYAWDFAIGLRWTCFWSRDMVAELFCRVRVVMIKWRVCVAGRVRRNSSIRRWQIPKPRPLYNRHDC